MTIESELRNILLRKLIGAWGVKWVSIAEREGESVVFVQLTWFAELFWGARTKGWVRKIADSSMFAQIREHRIKIYFV